MAGLRGWYSVEEIELRSEVCKESVLTNTMALAMFFFLKAI